MSFLLNMLRIRRVEFRIAEIPILAVPLLLTLRDTSQLVTWPFWEGVLIFFLLFAFGDMINCLADRDLDAVYKPHLSRAVYGLGLRFVTFQVIATAVASLLLAADLSWRLRRWPIFPLVAAGLMLGAAYSVNPVRLKGRGLAQLICLWLIIFVGPMLFVGLLVSSTPSATLILFAAAYGALQMGVILVNTAEDYPEDLESNVKTSIVSLGLHRGLNLARMLVTIGSAGVLAVFGLLFWQRAVGPRLYLALIPTVAACAFVLWDISRLNGRIRGMALNESLSVVKQRAKRVPLWLTLIAWSVLAGSLSLFYALRVQP